MFHIFVILAISASAFGEECQTKMDKGASYEGHVNKTNSGKICQAWDKQTPHSHTLDADWVKTTEGHNYCRNPDGEDKVWCYTMDSTKRWEFCDVPVKDSCPEPTPDTTALTTEGPGPGALLECLVDQSVLDILKFTTKYQCDALKKQLIIVAEAIAFYGCSVEQEDNAEIISYNRTLLECDKLVLDKLVQVANMEKGDLPSFAILNQEMHKLPECGSSTYGSNRKQECDALHRVYREMTDEVYRMCIAPFPEIRSGCNWWEISWILVGVIGAYAGCVAAAIAGGGFGVAACIAAALNVSGQAITCVCKEFEFDWCSPSE